MHILDGHDDCDNSDRLQNILLMGNQVEQYVIFIK